MWSECYLIYIPEVLKRYLLDISFRFLRLFTMVVVSISFPFHIPSFFFDNMNQCVIYRALWNRSRDNRWIANSSWQRIRWVSALGRRNRRPATSATVMSSCSAKMANIVSWWVVFVYLRGSFEYFLCCGRTFWDEMMFDSFVFFGMELDKSLHRKGKRCIWASIPDASWWEIASTTPSYPDPQAMSSPGARNTWWQRLRHRSFKMEITPTKRISRNLLNGLLNWI